MDKRAFQKEINALVDPWMRGKEKREGPRALKTGNNYNPRLWTHGHFPLIHSLTLSLIHPE